MGRTLIGSSNTHWEGKFWTSGPLPFEHPTYQVRKADELVFELMQEGRYVMLETPHQMGATSLLFRLMRISKTTNLIFAYVDFSQLTRADETLWYQELGYILETQLDWEAGKAEVSTAIDLRHYLERLAISKSNSRIVIIWDEVGAAYHFEWAERFFSLLRHLWNTRARYSWAIRISFILAGRFKHEDLVMNKNISPFNIGHVVYLDELGKSQVLDLVGLLGVPKEAQLPIAERVYHWTSGHPYLVQLLCASISHLESVSLGDVDSCVKELLLRDTNHFPFLLRDVRTLSRNSQKTLCRLLEGERRPFSLMYSSLNELHLLGLIKDDSEGKAVIRNRMYEEFLGSTLFSSREPSHEAVRMLAESVSAASGPRFDVFLSYQRTDQKAVEYLARRLREAGLQVWLDRWNLIPGEPWQEAVEEALDDCATCVVFWGPRGLGPWQNEEMRAALERRARERSYRVIPVLLPRCPEPEEAEMPPFLKRVTWVDFREGLDDLEAFKNLVAGIRGVVPGPDGV